MRDAVPCERPGNRVRVQPRHAAVWIQVNGVRWPADVHAWFRLDDGRWAVWLQRQDPDPARPGLWGAFVYDEQAIQPRE